MACCVDSSLEEAAEMKIVLYFLIDQLEKKKKKKEKGKNRQQHAIQKWVTLKKPNVKYII